VTTTILGYSTAYLPHQVEIGKCAVCAEPVFGGGQKVVDRSTYEARPELLFRHYGCRDHRVKKG